MCHCQRVLAIQQKTDKKLGGIYFSSLTKQFVISFLAFHFSHYNLKYLQQNMYHMKMAKTQLTICALVLLALHSCHTEKQTWNEKTDILLSYFSIGYKTTNSTDIPIMDIISGSMNATSLLLGDITTIKRLSDVVFETKTNGDTRISGIFGLEKFELKIQFASTENYSGPAIIKSQNNSADIAYTIKDPDNMHSCRTKWEHFILGEFSDIMVYLPSNTNEDGTNVTEEFNRRILPTLNHYFNTHEFLVQLSKTFDFCTLKRYLFPL